MNIKMDLNPKSTKQAINQFLKVQQMFIRNTITQAFLKECCAYLMTRMEYYLSASGVGANVVSDIMASWHINMLNNVCILENHDDKAVFVEFGVGMRAVSEPHPNAAIEHYKYDVYSDAKSADGSWSFYSDEDDLDIPKDAIEWGSNGQGTRNRMVIRTKGTKGVWYAFNALQDLRMNRQAIWQKVKERMIG